MFWGIAVKYLLIDGIGDGRFGESDGHLATLHVVFYVGWL
jgi:hypothetical protein